MSKEMTCLDILKAARAKIAKPEDWAKGMRPERTNFESCCAAEAIEEAISGTSLRYWPEKKMALRAYRNVIGIEDTFRALTDWNDAPERTHAEVLAAFDLAIACVRLT